MHVKNGDKARDVITGFEGVITATAHYLTGCDQVLIKPTSLDKENNTRKGEWFDVEQVERVGDGITLPRIRKTGGPQSDAPTAR